MKTLYVHFQEMKRKNSNGNGFTATRTGSEATFGDVS